MNRLNRKVEYALMALKTMSGQYAGGLITVKEICDSTGIPFDATSRVMQLMAQQKILKAEHGVNGGYRLAKNLSEVSLLEIIELASGPVEIVRCASTDGECEFFANCNLTSPLQSLNRKLAKFYEQLSIDEIIGSKPHDRKSNSHEAAK